MPRTSSLHSNCLFGIFYLLLRIRGKSLIIAKGPNWLSPYHPSILTNRGHLINFERLLNHKKNKFAPWWYLGSFEGVRKSKWKRYIRKRRGEYVELPILVGYLAMIVIYSILFFPWIIAWMFYGPYFTLSWGIHGFGQRFLKRKARNLSC